MSGTEEMEVSYERIFSHETSIEGYVRIDKKGEENVLE